MKFTNIYDLLEEVRTYPLQSGESLMQVPSVSGSLIIYATASTELLSKEWSMELRLAKETALARGSKESLYIRELLSSYSSRTQLLQELRSGTLEYGICREVPKVLEVPPPKIVQLRIPGL